MNFYFLFFFVILCSGSSDAVREVFHRFSKTRAGVTEETKGKSNSPEESELSVINGLVQVASQMKNWTHWFRRLLKTLRKWCNSHPPEIKLGKCLVSYFNIKIPGLRQYNKNGRYYEGSGEMEYSTKRLQLKREAITDCTSQKRIFHKTSFGIHFVTLSQKFFLEIIMNRFRRYHDIILRNDFVICLWNYFWKKFWIWVDSAPDVRFRI